MVTAVMDDPLHRPSSRTRWSVAEPKPNWQDSLVRRPSNTPSSPKAYQRNRNVHHNDDEGAEDINVNQTTATPSKSSPPSTPEPCPRRRPRATAGGSSSSSNHIQTNSALKKKGREGEILAGAPLLSSKRLSVGSFCSSASSPSPSCRQSTSVVTHPLQRNTPLLSMVTAATTPTIATGANSKRTSSSISAACSSSGSTTNHSCSGGIGHPSSSLQSRPPFVVSKYVSGRPRIFNTAPCVDTAERTKPSRRHRKDTTKGGGEGEGGGAEDEDEEEEEVEDNQQRRQQGRTRTSHEAESKKTVNIRGGSSGTLVRQTNSTQRTTAKGQPRESTGASTTSARRTSVAGATVTPTTKHRRVVVAAPTPASKRNEMTVTTTTTTTTTTRTTKTTRTKRAAPPAAKSEGSMATAATTPTKSEAKSEQGARNTNGPELSPPPPYDRTGFAGTTMVRVLQDDEPRQDQKQAQVQESEQEPGQEPFRTSSEGGEIDREPEPREMDLSGSAASEPPCSQPQSCPWTTPLHRDGGYNDDDDKSIMEDVLLLDSAEQSYAPRLPVIISPPASPRPPPPPSPFVSPRQLSSLPSSSLSSPPPKAPTTAACVTTTTTVHHVLLPHFSPCSPSSSPPARPSPKVEPRLETPPRRTSATKFASGLSRIPWTPCTTPPVSTDAKDGDANATKEDQEKEQVSFITSDPSSATALEEVHASPKKRPLQYRLAEPQVIVINNHSGSKHDNTKTKRGSTLLESIIDPSISSPAGSPSVTSTTPMAVKRSSLAGRALCIAAKDWIMAKNVLNGSNVLPSKSESRQRTRTTTTPSSNFLHRQSHSRTVHEFPSQNPPPLSSSYLEPSSTPSTATSGTATTTIIATTNTPTKEVRRLSIPLKVKRQYLEKQYQTQKRNSTLIQFPPTLQPSQASPTQPSAVEPRTCLCACQSSLEPPPPPPPPPPKVVAPTDAARPFALQRHRRHQSAYTPQRSTPALHVGGEVSFPFMTQHFHTNPALARRASSNSSSSMLHRGTSGRVARGGRNDLDASPASELSVRCHPAQNFSPSVHGHSAHCHVSREEATLHPRCLQEHVRPAITRRVSSSPSLPPPKSVPPKPDVAVTSWLLPKPNPRQDSANSPPSINTHVEPSKDMATLAKARASRRMDMTLLTKRLLNLHRLESVCSTERLQDLFTPSSPPTIAHRGGLEEQPNSSTMEDPSSSSSSSSTTAPSLLLRPKEGKTRDCQLWSLELQNTLSNLSFTDCVLPPTEYPWSVAARRVHREDDENERYGGGDGDEEVGPEQYVHGHGEQDNSETLHPHHHHHHHRHQSHSSPPPWISPVVPARRTLVDEEHEHILTLDWLHRLQRLPPSLLELYPGVKREIQKLTIQV